MTKDEALRMALEALEEIHTGNMTPMAEGNWNKAIAAIREALAEQPAQQQEPVAWHHPECKGACIACLIEQEVLKAYGNQGLNYLRRYVLSPPASKPWAGLTDEMVVAAARMWSDRQAAACNVDCGDMWKMHGNDFIEDARAALEAAHGIKENT